MISARFGTAVPTWTRLLAVALSTGALASGCGDATNAALNDEWQKMMRCSAYYSLRAESVQGSRTAAGRRTADTAQADAALTYRSSHDLGRLGGHTLRLRTRYEDQCTTIVTGGGARIEYWSHELDD
jgi:hypothetical protein